MNDSALITRPAAEPAPPFIYLPDMTDADYALGFRYREVASPTVTKPLRRVIAAVFHIDVSNRIVRVHDPVLNRPGYVHQCFGITKRSNKCAWRPVQLKFPDAKMAIRSWKNGLDNQQFGDGMFACVEGRLPTADEY